MRKIPTPSHYYEVLRLINKNKTPYQDRYFIVLNQVEISKELGIVFSTINTLYRDYKANDLIVKEGMNYYLTQKGVKMVTMYEEDRLDFICYYNLLKAMCNNLALTRDKMLMTSSYQELQIRSDLTEKELLLYLDVMSQKNYIEIDNDRKYITPKAIEAFLFYTQNFFAGGTNI